MSEHLPHLLEQGRHVVTKIAVGAAALTSIAGFAPSETQDRTPTKAPVVHVDTAPSEQIAETPEAAPTPQTSTAPHKEASATKKPVQSNRRFTYMPPKHTAPKSSEDHPHKPTSDEARPSETRPGLGILNVPESDKPRTKELKVVPPANLITPPEVLAAESRNTVYIPELRCSGALEDNADGIMTGMESSEHCGLKGTSGKRGTDENGQPIITFDQPLIVQTGDVMGNLTTVGEVKQLAVNADNDTTKDQVYGAFEGHTLDEVIQDAAQLTPEEIANIEPGTTLYNSGWPVDQKNNTGPTKRQTFAMTVLGTAEWNVGDQGEHFKLLIAAVPVSEDGAECSWGDSGSRGSVMFNDQLRKVGNLSAFNDFGFLYQKDPAAGTAVRQNIENTFGISMEGYGAVCGFAYEEPKVEDGAVFANVVTPPKIELAPETPLRQFENRYAESFFQNRRVIKGGTVQIPSPKGDTFLKDPAISEYDPESGYMLLSGYANNKIGLAMLPVHIDTLNMLSIYKNGDELPHFADSTGEVTFPLDGQPQHFTDAGNPDGFGEFLQIDHIDGAVSSRLILKDGQLALEEITEKGGVDPQPEVEPVEDPANTTPPVNASQKNEPTE